MKLLALLQIKLLRIVKRYKCGRETLVWCVGMRRPPPSIYSCPYGRFARDIHACPHATDVGRSPGDATWRPEAVGVAWGRTLGAAVPWWCLPTTAFRMVVRWWAWVTSTSVLGPDSQGRWDSLLVSLLCFVGKRIFVTFSTVFVYMSCKIIIFQYKWK